MKEKIKKFLPSFLIGWYHFFMALLGVLIYRFPSRKLKVIGVTGTNGKSTVVEMVSKILEDYNPPTTLPLASGERAPAGYKVASISSIKFKIGDKEWLNTLKMTMPGRFKIQKFLRQAAETNCQYLVLEVTSEGIKQHRHRFIDFAVAVFTNLTPEHIETHGGFEKYREAKRKLFKATKGIHIINLDDENAEYFLRFPAHKKIGFTLNEMSREPFSAIKAKNIQVLQSGLKFFVDDTEFNLKLLGEFNIYNALAAICVGLSQGISLETCKKALEKIEVIPGRMEEVISQPFKVFVDYAFTPNALEKVYQTIKNNFKPKKLICVLGATGGGRDKWKRPILGKLTREYCDEVIVTNEDPYNEDPMEIINQVADGAGEKAKKFLDRRRAISEALKIAKEGDVIIITGKGCEPWICVTGGKKIPWDDRQVVKEEFRKIYEKV
jgi:UDP-N-acetylmuramoyl-L-alanyl-D-glutamate--2,6-diaminopimelate ligase